MNRWSRSLGGAVVGLLVFGQTASAIPAFARKYRVSCVQCHAPVPRLNAFGEAFAANGFEFAVGEPPRDTVGTGDALLRLQNDLPLAIRYDAYFQARIDPKDGQNAADFQSPWIIKLLSGGQVADKISYYLYFLLAERGEVAGLEDAYVQFTDVANTGVSLIVGQFQVSDPLFKRELRLEYEDYQAYRVRVGETAADLTYDRGLMALWSPREGTDVSVQLVAGRGLNEASGNRQFDGDDAKATMLRVSQDFGSLRLGAFGYRGDEVGAEAANRITMWGPDATLALGSVGEINAQFIQRKDRDPFFAGPFGPATVPRNTTVKSGFAEAVFWPQGQSGRLFFTALYNWVNADDPVVSLRLGEQDTSPGYLSKFSSASAGMHYLFKRNVRLMGEAGWDFERDQARFVLGTMLAF